MKFTYQAYRDLLRLLQERGYAFSDYHNWEGYPRCVILRHDIDQDLHAALRLAEVEAEMGITSTWFVLLRTNFYNPAAKESLECIRKIRALGHEIGLHFDEVAHEGEDGTVIDWILREVDILSAICRFPIKSVSMHRPSKATLEADIQIPGIVNSYGKTFFKDFKYLSDSRRHWKEPVLDIVRTGDYDRLHILTHAFWYREEEESLSQSVKEYVLSANRARYSWLADNIRDLPGIMEELD